MRKLVVGCFAIIISLMSGALQPAMALPQAYVLVEKNGVDIDTVRPFFHGIMNCKALFGQIVHSEVIVRLECNDLKNLNTAITNNVLRIEGVSRATIWVVKSQ